jgi:hypothetical protein
MKIEARLEILLLLYFSETEPPIWYWRNDNILVVCCLSAWKWTLLYSSYFKVNFLHIGSIYLDIASYPGSLNNH